MNIVQSITLVSLGILIESKEKREKVFGLMNNLGKTAEKMAKQINKSGVPNVQTVVEKTETEYK